MKDIKISGVKTEVVEFLKRKSQELSATAGRKITRNEYINLILEEKLREELSTDGDKIKNLASKIDYLASTVMKYSDATNRLINLIYSEGDQHDE